MRAFLLSLFAFASACGGSVAAFPEEDAQASADGSVTDTAAEGGEDGGVAPGSGTIKCGTTTCSAATQDCCATFSGSRCVAKGTCSGGTTLSCSSSASCPTGQSCCLSRSGSRCEPTCPGIVLCDGDSECRDGQRCVNGTGGYKYCRSPGGFDAGPRDGGGWFDGGGGGGGGWFDSGGFDAGSGG